MKLKEIGISTLEETTSAGSIAAVASNLFANPIKRTKKKKNKNPSIYDSATPKGEVVTEAHEMDHEVSMALSDLYKLAKYAIKLHDMVANVSETQGLEGWVQSKITKASDYIGAVYHHLDHEMNHEHMGEKAPPGREEQVKALKGKVDNPYAVAWASYNKSKKGKK